MSGLPDIDFNEMSGPPDIDPDYDVGLA